MTKEQKIRIMQLRSANTGYKRIAETLGISPNTVKSFCRRNGFTVTASPIVVDSNEAEVSHSRQGEEATLCEVDAYACRQCGKHIEQIPGRKAKRFCSDACRMKWWRAHDGQMAHRNTRMVICPGCGTSFEVYGAHPRKYCCRACYVRHRFAKGAICS